MNSTFTSCKFITQDSTVFIEKLPKIASTYKVIFKELVVI